LIFDFLILLVVKRIACSQIRDIWNIGFYHWKNWL